MHTIWEDFEYFYVFLEYKTLSWKQTQRYLIKNFTVHFLTVAILPYHPDILVQNRIQCNQDNFFNKVMLMKDTKEAFAKILRGEKGHSCFCMETIKNNDKGG